MSASDHYQAIVIGSGHAGTPLRIALAKAGLRTALMKAIVDADTGHIPGAAVLGLEGGEIMSLLQLAILGKLRDSDLRDAVFAHPTLAESRNNLFAHRDT